MSSTAFVTGIGGFAGSHLAEALLRAGHRVEGTVRPGRSPGGYEQELPAAALHACDVRSSPALTEAIRRARPDVVYHLAASTSVSEGEADPGGTLEVNLTGTLHLLEAIRKESPGALLVYVSSSEVYGRVRPDENPVREDRPEAPLHFYGLSKFLSEQLVRFYQRRHGLAAVILRPFNHIGPRQSDRFVCGSFVRQLVLIERAGASPVLRVGNLDPVRDFTDVRDMVRAYRLAAQHCRPGSLFNVASGRGTSIGELLSRLLSLFPPGIEIRKDPDRIRKTEIPVLIGDATSFRATTGWDCRFELTETLRDTVAYWRRIAGGPLGQ